MILNLEEEARKKVCPFMTRTQLVMCKASECMAWRFHPYPNQRRGYCERVGYKPIEDE
jgi:hypothetical protein